jgi:glycerol-3-phosphate acyltransferase PlsX
MRIGVDILGGDFWPEAPVEGAVLALDKFGPDIELVLIGDENLIRQELAKHGADPSRFSIVNCTEMVGMEESPTKGIASKPNSTINVGIGMVKTGQLDGFVSAGNTGAMLVASIMGLGRIPGVNRPTIGALFPNHNGEPILLLDVGANVDSKPEHILHYARLGSIYMESVRKVEKPRVGLMNVGEEESKGPADVKAAHALLKESGRLNFVGNVEGRDIYHGKADVYVCDGYTGNIILKFGESMYDVLKSRYAGDAFIEAFNFENYGGVPILGIRGISIIGHGISNGKAIASMIGSAVEAVRNGLVQKIEAAFQTDAQTADTK